MAKKNPPSPDLTNITEKMRKNFQALSSGKYDNFALFSCFVNGEPAAAIVAIVTKPDKTVEITPLFVTITPSMILTDHDGVSSEHQPSPSPTV